MKFLALALFLSLSAAQAESIDSSKLPKGFDLAAAIGGDYGNSLGDKAAVTVTAEEQSDLFAPKNYSVEFTIERDGDVVVALDDRDFDSIGADGSVNFSGSTECDDPGCTSGEYSFAFKKKKDGSFYLAGEVNFSSEVNEDVEAWFEGDIADLTEQDVQKYCRESFGEKAEGSLEGSAYCQYTKSFQLKKLK